MASSRRNKNEKVVPSRLGPEQQSIKYECEFIDNVLSNSSWSRWWKTIVLPLLQQCLCRLLTGKRRRRRTTTTTTTHQRLQHQRQSSLAIVVLRRIFFVSCFLSLFFTVSYHLDQRIENDYHHTNQIAMTEQYNRQQQQQQQQENDGQQSTMKSISVSLDDNKPSNSYRNNNNSSNNSNNDGSKMDRKNHRHRRSSTTPSTMTMEKNVLSHYLTNSSNTTTNVNLTLQEASKGREHVLSILKDAGIDTYDPMDVLRLPMWSSVTELYYPNNNSSNRNSSATSMDGGGGAAAAATTAGRSGKKDGNDYDNSEPRSGPIIIGLDTCEEFRQRVKYSDRFLGIAGNFNSGTTAFAITLQNNCHFLTNKDSSGGDGGEDSSDYSTTTNNDKDTVISITKDIKSVNRILNQVPWRKHKMSQYRDLYIKNNNNHPTTENTIIKGENVLPIVLIRGELELESSQVKSSQCHTQTKFRFLRKMLPVLILRLFTLLSCRHRFSLFVCIHFIQDPMFWMQSMCKEGYGVRWDHNSKYHCPNLVPNEYDKKQFKRSFRGNNNNNNNTNSSSVQVWMGPNRQVGPTWPSLIHYWNEWYESYLFNNTNNSTDNNNSKYHKEESASSSLSSSSSTFWPRLIVRFEDTLFYPRQVIEKVCNCGGGTMKTSLSNSNSTSTSTKFIYNINESKPDHNQKIEHNNFITAMIKYGNTDAYSRRIQNMTSEDIQFAIQTLNPKIMKLFQYTYPI